MSLLCNSQLKEVTKDDHSTCVQRGGQHAGTQGTEVYTHTIEVTRNLCIEIITNNSSTYQ